MSVHFGRRNMITALESKGESMSRRAELLAARIEEGANGLAAFAEKLSDAEWKSPGSTGGSDRRPVGVVIHHVASVYPIEVDLAKTIGSGKAVTEVTWEAVAELNAGHSKEKTGVGKAETLELLRKNSREAAAVVRAFTDEQLDTAAPFGLSYNAPVTAQFVIEDHAVRHSWHHLAKIKKALGR
jgi:DinB superfamily